MKTILEIHLNSKYFKNIKEALSSYKTILMELSNCNYSLGNYLKQSIANKQKITYYIERNFSIKKIDNKNKESNDSELILCDSTACSVFSNGKTYKIIDEFENSETVVKFYIVVEFVTFYIHDSICYVKDFKNKKSYCVYLDHYNY